MPNAPRLALVTVSFSRRTVLYDRGSAFVAWRTALGSHRVMGVACALDASRDCSGAAVIAVSHSMVTRAASLRPPLVSFCRKPCFQS